MIYFLYLLVILMVANGWMLVCNNRTHAQRSVLFKTMVVWTDPDYEVRLAVFDAVSYEKHLWTLFTFRKADNLYKWNKT